MGTWYALLTVGAILCLGDVNAEDCPLNGDEENPWLIRITPMKLEDAKEGDAGAGDAPVGSPAAPRRRRSNDNHDGNRYDIANVEGLDHYQYKRQEPQVTDTTVLSAEPLNEKETSGKAETEVTNDGSAEENRERVREGERDLKEPPGSGLDLKKVLDLKPIRPKVRSHHTIGCQTQQPEPGTTTMHGALIKPDKVLTSMFTNHQQLRKDILKKGELSLVGYNARKNCFQEQWGKKVETAPHASEFALNAAMFSLVTVYDAFSVEGEPFLFGTTGYPPVKDILPVLHSLKNVKGDVMMYTFRDEKTKRNGTTNNESLRSTIIPWKICQEMENVIMAVDNTGQHGKGMSPRVTTYSYFCSTSGQPSVSTKEGEKLVLCTDWYQGAPVVYVQENGNKLPIGHYVYRVGQTQDLIRMYATYSNTLSKFLGGPEVDISLTIPPEESNDTPPNEILEDPMGPPSDSPPRITAAHPTKLRERGLAPERNLKANGSECEIAELWVVTMCITFASAIRFVK